MKTKEPARDFIRRRLREVLAEHVGVDKAITLREIMGEVLEREVSKIEVYDGIGRDVRDEISNLIHLEGLPVMSTSSGYFLVKEKEDLEACARMLRSRALALLAREAKLKKVSLVEVTGQLTLDLVRTEEKRREEDPEAGKIPARYDVITKFLSDPLDADTRNLLQANYGAMFMPRGKMEQIKGTVQNLMRMLE